MRVKRYVPHMVVFITSMGVMIVELIASRVVSKHFGNSLYTWTGIIGVVLGGISLGNYTGGRLADRFQPRKIIGPQLLLTAVLVMGILPLDAMLYLITMKGEAVIVTSQMVLQSILWIVILFLLPSAALGTVSPVMAKYALEQSSRVGNTVGSIYAISSIGSIVGTFLSGYLLIPAMGVRAIVFLVAATVALLGLLMANVTRHRVAAAALVAVICVLGLTLPGSVVAREYYEAGGAKLLFSTDSQYMHIEVRDTPRSEGANTVIERQLIMDGLIHNRYDIGNPDDLRYEYELIFESLTRHFVDDLSGDKDLHTLTVGGGGMVFPYYLERHYPESRNDVVEIDPEVIRVAKRYFDVPDSLHLRIFEADGRNYVNFARTHGVQYDLVYLDAFTSFSIPAHLTTREFGQEVAAILKPGGYVFANCIDVFSVGKFISAYIRTLQTVFPAVTVYADTTATFNQRMTFIIAGGPAELSPELLYSREGKLVGRKVSDALISALLNRNGGTVLTDDYAPVENLMAPVFLHSVR